MTDQFPPPNQYLWPDSWPYWIRNSLLWPFAPPSSQKDTWDQSSLPGAETPNGGILGTIAQSNDTRDRSTPTSLYATTPFSSSGGILGTLADPDAIREQNSPTWVRSATSSANHGILGPRTQLDHNWTSIDPHWNYLPTHLPATLIASSAQPFPLSPSPTFPPASPIDYLDLAQHRGGAPAPLEAGEPPFIPGFYLSPLSQAPSRDQIPTPAVENTGWTLPQPPNPSRWGIPASAGTTRSSLSSEFADVNGSMLGLFTPPAKQQRDATQLMVPMPSALPPVFSSARSIPPWEESTLSLWQQPADTNFGIPASPTAPELDAVTAPYLRAPRLNPETQDYGRQSSNAMLTFPQPFGPATPSLEHLEHSQAWSASQPDGVPWTNDGRVTNDPTITSDAMPDNEWRPQAQYANGPRRGSVPVRIGEHWVAVEPGQAARYETAVARAQDAVRRVREADSNWRPKGTRAYGAGIESEIRKANDLAEEANARVNELARLEPLSRNPTRRPLTSEEWSRDYYLIEAYRDPPRTLEELQRAVSRPKPGYDVHHIAEQTSAERDGFPRSTIDAPENLVRIPRMKHWEINAWYGKRNKEFGGASPREYLRGKDWSERVRVGTDALIKHEVLKP